MWGARGVRLGRYLGSIRRGVGSSGQQSVRDSSSPWVSVESSPLRGLAALSFSTEASSALVGKARFRPTEGVIPCWNHVRYGSQGTAAVSEGDFSETEQLLPKEEEKAEEVILGFPRHGSGKIVSKKERRVGRVPSVVFSQENGHIGGDKQLISVDTKQMERLIKRLGKSFFLSSTFELEVRDDAGNVQAKERVLPRSIHLHAGTDKVMNVTFIRAPPTASLKVDVPLIFIGEDACPGLRKGGYIYTMMRTVKYRCPGNAIPSGIEVDLSTLDMGEKILLRDLNAPSGLSLVKKDSSLPVCKVMGSRTSSAAASSEAAS